jgi:carbon storage regulator
MLVLSRNLNDSIIINDNITVTVLGVNGSNVKLGITAPKEIPVHRNEIFERIQREGLRDKKEFA